MSQVQPIKGRLHFALPQGERTRVADMPSSMAEELKRHVAAFPPVERHPHASLMLEAGESVVTVARWLGHSSPAITLGYYAHFMPEAGSKGRTAIDGLLGRQEICMPVETPQSLPRATDGQFPLIGTYEVRHGLQGQ